MTTEPTATDDAILSPEELLLEERDDYVDELGENRYVVRAEPSNVAGKLPISDETTAVSTGSIPSLETWSPPRDPLEGAESTARRPLEAAPEPHGVDITLKTDGELAHLRTTSNDVREVFRELLTWYANQLDEDLTPTQALEVMLRTTNLE